MKMFVVSLVAACALLAALATSALADTDGHFPEGTPAGQAGQGCETVPGTAANGSGSATGGANKTDLFVDSCTP
jgi:hypothetical protein